MSDVNPSTAILSISRLNRLVRERLESGFPLCWVAGEISNLTIAASGHAYFSLKDDGAMVRCVMFRQKLMLTGWRPQNGQRVEARVLVSLYEPRGDFQLNVETMRQAGQGNLHEQFLRLKEQLTREGLFDPAAKRPLPAFPRRIGLITSPQAAALRDVLSTLARRAPQVDIVLFPTAVQGDGAGPQIAAAIARAGHWRDPGDGAGCDLILVCRGGGSLEDLWAFNDPAVARALRASPLPSISGVGHETDVTLCDFAADLRAPTPTAAAELSTPERAALHAHLGRLAGQLARQWQRGIERHAQRIDGLARRLRPPSARLSEQRRQLDHLRDRLGSALLRHTTHLDHRLAALSRRLLLAPPRTAPARQRLERLGLRLSTAAESRLHARQARLDQLRASLAHLNPDAVLARGYALVRDGTGRLVCDAQSLEPGAPISVYVARGRIEAEVLATRGPDAESPATSP